jgi:hypothetical protein
MSLFEDRNKTEMTKAVTAAAVNYLAERGFKPVETEVPVCDGWVADIAGVVDPTTTELIKLRVLRRAPGYDGRDVQSRYSQWRAERDRVFKVMTALVEVKASRSDFEGDKKWTRQPPTDLAYLAIPCHLPIECPDGWGLLLYHPEVNCVRLVNVPPMHEVTAAQQRDVILEIAMRQYNDIHYAGMKTSQREFRATETREVSRLRLFTALQAVVDIAEHRHETLERTLEVHGIRDCPKYLMERLVKLWEREHSQQASS